MYTPEENAFINATRAKLASGGFATKEEEKAAIRQACSILRQKRNSAVASAKKRKAAAPSADANALLNELEGL